MDRKWIRNRRLRHKQEYIDGILSFIEVAKQHVNARGRTSCPCVKCLNKKYQTIPVVQIHLAKNGMLETYVIWREHGETVPTPTPIVQDAPGPIDDIHNILNDAFPVVEEAQDVDMEDCLEGGGDTLGGMGDAIGDDEGAKVNRIEADQYEKLLAEAERELFPGSNGHSVLTAMVKLMHCKVLNHWTNKSFDMLLEWLNQQCPKPNNIPSSFYEANKMLKNLGLGYEKIDVCKNDCALFYKEHEKKENCPECGEARYKPSPCFDDAKKKKKIPHKVLHYFPLKPRLQRLFMSRHTYVEMRWHKERRLDQHGTMRHPADSLVWKEFDKMYPEFAEEPRNVRLGLATDGFNPFGNMSLSYSMWPVMVVP
ncbi:hypothetical protein M0R45_001923 [Rubus argutus]|uniref:Transposase-associated domain-containing protein n=1 Tax=Rubus argutus TaxID=59490 RepID=A0AAW1VKF5_RUBAR